MSFDAVSIEYAFANLIGNPIGARGTSHDADVFRGGEAKSLSFALSEAIDALEAKVNALKFDPEESQPGGTKARLDVAIDRLKRIAETMSKSKAVAGEDYHWEIIGCLVSTIAALLVKARG